MRKASPCQDAIMVTGLDPAGPWFHKYSEEARLSPNSAKLVDVIHTDGGAAKIYYGMLNPVGQIDYYPNEGKAQPGCWTDIDGDGIPGKDTLRLLLLLLL